MNDSSEALDEEFDPVTNLVAPLMDRVMAEVKSQRHRHDGDLGIFRDYPDGSGGTQLHGPTLAVAREIAREKRRALVEATRTGRVTWRHLLESELAEVLSEGDPKRLREALVSMTAHSLSWVEAIDRRKDEKRIERKQRPKFWARVRAWFKRGRR